MPDDPLPDYYKIFHINPEAPDDEDFKEVVKAAYHRLAQKYHADTTKEPDPKKAEQRMKDLNNAKEVLLDSAKRRAYDTKRKEQEAKRQQEEEIRRQQEARRRAEDQVSREKAQEEARRREEAKRRAEETRREAEAARQEEIHQRETTGQREEEARRQKQATHSPEPTRQETPPPGASPAPAQPSNPYSQPSISYDFSPYGPFNPLDDYRRASGTTYEPSSPSKRKRKPFHKKVILTLFVIGSFLFVIGFFLVGALSILAAILHGSTQNSRSGGFTLTALAILPTLVGAALYLAAVVGTLIGSAKENRWGVFFSTFFCSFVGVLVYYITD